MALFAVNLNNGVTDEKGIFRLLGRMLTRSGVIESTALTVAAQSTPDMTVRVSGSVAADNAVFLTTNGDCYHGWNTAGANVTIATNSSGVTVSDAIVAYINTAAGSTTANNPNGMVLTAVRGASGTTTDAEINTAISSKPFIRLADVTVANAVTSINSGNIADTRLAAQLGIAASSLSTSAITLGFSESTTSTSTITTEVDITGLSVTITIPEGGRRLKLTANTKVFGSDTNTRPRINIKEGATELGRAIGVASPVTNVESALTAFAVITPSAGTHTYKVTGIKETGLGSFGVASPSFLLAELI